MTSSNQRLHVLPREHVTRHFGIVEIVERTDKFVAPGTEPGTVSTTLSSFLVEQLVAQQFVRFDWAVVRGALQAPPARRRYVFLETQRVSNDGTLLRDHHRQPVHGDPVAAKTRQTGGASRRG